MNSKQKTILAVGCGILLTLPIIALGQGYELLAPFPGTGDSPSLSSYLVALFKMLLGAAVILAVIMIVIGGVQYMGSESIFSHEDSKKRIWGAVFGLLLAFLAYIILQTINPGLLNVGFSLVNLNIQGGGVPEGMTPSNFCFQSESTDPQCGSATHCGASLEECEIKRNAFISAGNPAPTACLENNCEAVATMCPATNMDVCAPTNPGRNTSSCGPYFTYINSSGAADEMKAIIVMESSCNPNAGPSSAGACGIAQLLPSTARNFAGGCGVPNPSAIDCAWLKANPEKSICIGSNYFRGLSGNAAHGFAGYNGGPAALLPSNSCGTGSPLPSDVLCGGTVIPNYQVRRWQCPYDDINHTTCNTGPASYEETRNYVRGALYLDQIL